MNNFGDKKKEIRKEIRQISLEKEYVQCASKVITDKILGLDCFKNAKSIFCYLSTDDEVSTWNIINEVITDKKVYVPYCADKEKMIAVRYSSDDELNKNKYGIYEPVDISETETDFDVVIVPCLSAGRNCSRLGHGRGYYDRFLKNTETTKICLCFEKLMKDDLPMDENDIYMNMIITEENVYLLHDRSN